MLIDAAANYERWDNMEERRKIHRGVRRLYTRDEQPSIIWDPDSFTFPCSFNGNKMETTVQGYFQQIYDIKLRFPKVSCCLRDENVWLSLSLTMFATKMP